MAHMQPQITEKMFGWEVETTHGTEWIPEDVAPVPDWLKLGVGVTDDDGIEGALFGLIHPRLRDYVEGAVLSFKVCHGYFARLSAPGYLDSTTWTYHKTIKEARASLCEF